MSPDTRRARAPAAPATDATDADAGADRGGSPPVPSRPTAAVGESVEHLRLRLARGEVHGFVHELWRRITGDPGVPAPGSPAERAGLAAGLIQALAGLRLGAAARHVLELVPEAAAVPGPEPGGAADAPSPADAHAAHPATPPEADAHAAHPAAPPARDAVRRLDEQLAVLPDGRLDWARFDRTLVENHAVLAEHHPRAAERLGSLASLRARRDRLEIHRDAAGLVHVLDRGAPGEGAEGAAVDPDTGLAPRPRPRWVGGFVDRRAERGFEAPRVGSAPARLLIVGAGTGRLVDRVVATTTTSAGVPPVHVHLIESDVDAMLAWLALADRRTSLADPRLLLFAGPAAVADWRARLEDRAGIPMPDHVLVADPTADAEAVARARAAVTHGRTARIEAAVASLGERWADRTDAAAAAAIRPGATVVGFTSRHTTMLKFAMRDVADAFERLGYRFVTVEEPSDGEHLFAADIADVLDREDAALVVAFNRLRPGAMPLFGAAPLLTLVLDPVDEILSREGARRVGRRDVVCGFYADRAVADHGYPPRRYLPLSFFPIATSTFHDAPLTPAEAERFDCDLVYVGHPRGTADAWHAHCTRSFPPEIAPVLDAARAMLEERTHDPRAVLHVPACRAIVNEACARTGVDLSDRMRSNVATMHVHRLHDIAWRREALGWAADWARRTGRSLHLHGDGWERDPEFAEFARGPVDRAREARLAYRGARLALQLLPTGLVHQRTFEAVASGALVVARESPHDFARGDRHRFRETHGDGATAPTMLYRAGARSIDELVFAGPEELHACLERWLEDDAAREARRAALAGIVRERFTWDAVLPRILDGTRAAIGLD